MARAVISSTQAALAEGSLPIVQGPGAGCAERLGAVLEERRRLERSWPTLQAQLAMGGGASAEPQTVPPGARGSSPGAV